MGIRKLLSSLSAGMIVLALLFTGVVTVLLFNDYADTNQELAREILSGYGQQMVSTEAELMSAQLSRLLQSRDAKNYPALRKDPEVRALATADIMIEGRKAGYFDVLDRKGVSVLHPNREVEGRNFSEWADQYPKMWSLVSRSFSESRVQGTYDFLDSENRTREKFMVLRAIAGTELILVAAVNIDTYFLPVQERIVEAGRGMQHAFLWRLGILALAVLVAGVVFSVWIAGRIARPVNRLAEGMEMMSRGDFTRELEPEGALELRRLGEMFNGLRQRLSVLLDEVRHASSEITSVASRITATSMHQEQSVSDFGASTNQIVAAAREITVTSRELAGTTGRVSESAQNVAEMAGEGKSDLEDMRDAMNRMVEATGSISDKLSVISEHATSIGSIITTIARVADQTNLLSLNASIEAEKAGNTGAGFAVVAREIRRLADQTALSTLDVEKMVHQMQTSVRSGVMEMERFSRYIGDGVDRITGLGERFAGVIEGVQQLTPRFEEIAAGMNAQSEGARQITEAMVQLNESASVTADAVHEFERVTTELRESASHLKEAIGRFRIQPADNKGSQT